MRLPNNRILGRYINPETGRAVNVHTGRWMQRGVDILYFLRSGKRVYITDRDFYNDWKKEDAITKTHREADVDPDYPWWEPNKFTEK